MTLAYWNCGFACVGGDYVPVIRRRCSLALKLLCGRCWLAYLRLWMKALRPSAYVQPAMLRLRVE
jgi:hypothetical protein